MRYTNFAVPLYSIMQLLACQFFNQNTFLTIPRDQFARNPSTETRLKSKTYHKNAPLSRSISTQSDNQGNAFLHMCIHSSMHVIVVVVAVEAAAVTVIGDTSARVCVCSLIFCSTYPLNPPAASHRKTLGERQHLQHQHSPLVHPDRKKNDASDEKG